MEELAEMTKDTSPPPKRAKKAPKNVQHPPPPHPDEMEDPD